MDTAEERLGDYEKVIYLTHYRMYNVTNKWARRDIQSQAMTDSSYLKRRVVTLWPHRHTSIENRDKICKAIKYLKRLKGMYNAEADDGMY